MKTLTTREFFHSPGLIKSLGPGSSLIVTAKGKPAFMVTKAGKRPIKAAEDLRREAREIFPGDRPRVNFTAIMKSLNGGQAVVIQVRYRVMKAADIKEVRGAAAVPALHRARQQR